MHIEYLPNFVLLPGQSAPMDVCSDYPNELMVETIPDSKYKLYLVKSPDNLGYAIIGIYTKDLNGNWFNPWSLKVFSQLKPTMLSRIELTLSACNVSLPAYEGNKFFGLYSNFNALALRLPKAKKIEFINADSWVDKLKIINSAFSVTIKNAVARSGPKDIQSEIKSLITRYPSMNFLERDLAKLESLSPTSTEFSQVNDYLWHMLSIPWGEFSDTQISLPTLSSTLNSTHFGLQDVKQVIIEHFYTCSDKGEVLCFDGPPGTGKTTFARAIAAAYDRPLVSISLAGLVDVSELRGNRRSYLSSRPGKIAACLSKAKVMNPVVLLDEIDKAGTLHGNPCDVLLEVLDPTQNNEYMDSYLDCPIDLSRAIFICTTNNFDSLSEPLKNRLQRINFPKYNKDEMISIINLHLIPKYFKLYNLPKEIVTLTQEFINELSSLDIRTVEKVIKQLLKKANYHFFTKKESLVATKELFGSFVTEIKKPSKIGY